MASNADAAPGESRPRVDLPLRCGPRRALPIWCAWGTMLEPVAAASAPRTIGELRERSLHAGLKSWYTRPRDRVEVPMEGYIIDLVRRGTLIEIQTRGFGKLRPKLNRLVGTHRVRVVFPIAERKWIVTADAEGCVLRRRLSPKRGAYRDLFAELMRIPNVMGSPNFTLEVLLVKVEELRCADGRGSWRRKGVSVLDTRLLEVVGGRRFRTPADLARLIPPRLQEPFTNRALAAAAGMSLAAAGEMTYTLRRMGALAVVGRRSRAYLFART